MPSSSSSRCLQWLGCLLAAAGWVNQANLAHATLFAYEPFEFGDVAVPSEGQYALGNESTGINVLGGQDPTIGPTAFYTGPWIQSGGDSQVVKPLPSLSYPGFPAGIGGVQQETVQFDCCSFGRTARAIAGGLNDAAGPRTIYESFLINFGTQGTDDPNQFGKRAHELFNGGVGDSFLTVDLFVNFFGGVDELSLSVTTPSGSTLVPVGGGGLTLDALSTFNGGVHLVVMKYEFHPVNPDVVSVYLDPMNFDIEPAIPDAQIAVAASDLAITHHSAFTNFTFSGSGHVPGAIDEIRWGDTYADVAPLTIPEPATLAIVAFGLAGLRRHRPK